MKLQIEILMGDRVHTWADVCKVLKPCCAFPYEELQITKEHTIIDETGAVIGNWRIS